MTLDRVGFLCCIEPNRDWVNAVSILATSLSSSAAGRGQPILDVVVVGQRIREGHGRLPSLVRLWPGARDAANPYLNKVLALRRSPEIFGASVDHVVLLDHDTIVVSLRGLRSLLTGHVRARVNYKYGLRRFVLAHRTRLSGFARRPWADVQYFNTGVVIVPVAGAVALAEAWVRCERSLRTLLKCDLWQSEQLAFALALSRLGVPCGTLPTAFNQTGWGRLTPHPRILHYNSTGKENKLMKGTGLASLPRFFSLAARLRTGLWRRYRSHILRLDTHLLRRVAAGLLREIQWR